MNLTATAQAAGLTNLVGALQQYAPQAVPALASARGITVFAPVDSAFQAAMSMIGQLNQTQIADVLLKCVGRSPFDFPLFDFEMLTNAASQPRPQRHRRLLDPTRLGRQPHDGRRRPNLLHDQLDRRLRQDGQRDGSDHPCRHPD